MTKRKEREKNPKKQESAAVFGNSMKMKTQRYNVNGKI
jgi:hypothetical protein